MATTQADVLRVIDETCGDAWCEGPYEFRFESLMINPETDETTVSFVWRNEFGKDTSRLHFSDCTISGFTRAEDIVKWDYVLDRGFFNELNDCIEDVLSRDRD